MPLPYSPCMVIANSELSRLRNPIILRVTCRGAARCARFLPDQYICRETIERFPLRPLIVDPRKIGTFVGQMYLGRNAFAFIMEGASLPKPTPNITSILR